MTTFRDTMPTKFRPAGVCLKHTPRVSVPCIRCGKLSDPQSMRLVRTQDGMRHQHRRDCSLDAPEAPAC